MFQILKISFMGLIKPAKYENAGKVDGVRTVLSILIIPLLIMIICTAIPGYFTLYDNAYLIETLDQVIPDFEFRKGRLECNPFEESWEKNGQTFFFSVDPTVEEYGENPSVLSKYDYDSVFLISATDLIVKNPTGEIDHMDLASIAGYFMRSYYKKDMLLDDVSYLLKQLYIIFCGIIYLASVIGLVLEGLFLALVGVVASSIFECRNSFSKLLRIAVCIQIPFLIIQQAGLQFWDHLFVMFLVTLMIKMGYVFMYVAFTRRENKKFTMVSQPFVRNLDGSDKDEDEKADKIANTQVPTTTIYRKKSNESSVEKNSRQETLEQKNAGRKTENPKPEVPQPEVLKRDEYLEAYLNSYNDSNGIYKNQKSEEMDDDFLHIEEIQESTNRFMEDLDKEKVSQNAIQEEITQSLSDDATSYDYESIYEKTYNKVYWEALFEAVNGTGNLPQEQPKQPEEVQQTEQAEQTRQPEQPRQAAEEFDLEESYFGAQASDAFENARKRKIDSSSFFFDPYDKDRYRR